MNKYLVKYLRLSKDDKHNGESNSIASQRQIIEDYAAASDELSGMPMIEFSDDGYTGTNFNRPGIALLLEAVKRGEVACIIVKDLSRFGRQYLEVSKFIEQIFPCFGIRFISVNDHYDSNSHKGTSAELDVPIRNMINAMYSKDISRKVRSAIITKKKQGMLLNNIAIFGYRVDNTEERRTVIDEPAAEIVRRIFAHANSGLSSFKIAEKLNSDNVITPAAYKTQNGCKLAFKTATRALWTADMVSSILREERYTGTLISCKRMCVELGTNKKKRLPKEEWIRKPDAHPAIIPLDLFSSVTEKRKKHSVPRGEANTDRVLYKKVYCGHCGHIMRYLTNYASYPQYMCRTAKYTNRFGCTQDKIKEQDMIDAVKAAVSEQMKILCNIEKLCKTIDTAKSSAERLDNEIKKLYIAKRSLYERCKKGEIDKQTYARERERVEVDTLLAANENQTNIYNSAQIFFQSFLKYQGLSEFDKVMSEKLIESIYVHGKDRIEIKFLFSPILTSAGPQGPPGCPGPRGPRGLCRAAAFPGCADYCLEECRAMQWMHTDCCDCGALRLSTDGRKIIAKEGCYSLSFTLDVCAAKHDERGVAVAVQTVEAGKRTERFVCHGTIPRGNTPFTITGAGIFIPLYTTGEIFITLLSPETLKVRQSSISIIET